MRNVDIFIKRQRRLIWNVNKRKENNGFDQIKNK